MDEKRFFSFLYYKLYFLYILVKRMTVTNLLQKCCLIFQYLIFIACFNECFIITNILKNIEKIISFYKNAKLSKISYEKIFSKYSYQVTILILRYQKLKSSLESEKIKTTFSNSLEMHCAHEFNI